MAVRTASASDFSPAGKADRSTGMTSDWIASYPVCRGRCAAPGGVAGSSPGTWCIPDDCSPSGPDAVSEISARELLRIGPSAASLREDRPEDGRKYVLRPGIGPEVQDEETTAVPEPWLPGPFDDGRIADARWIVSVDAGSHRSRLGRSGRPGPGRSRGPRPACRPERGRRQVRQLKARDIRRLRPTCADVRHQQRMDGAHPVPGGQHRRWDAYQPSEYGLTFSPRRATTVGAHSCRLNFAGWTNATHGRPMRREN